LLISYHGGARDIDVWLTGPVKRILQLLICIKEDSDEIKKAGKGSGKPNKSTLEMMEKAFMKRRKK